MQVSEGLQNVIDQMGGRFGAKSLYVVDIYAEQNAQAEQQPRVVLGMRDAETPVILARQQAAEDLGRAADQVVTVAILTDPFDEVEYVFDRYLLSYIATHGGIVTPVRIEENTGHLWISMDGGCSGCPSSIATLKGGIERTLKKHLPWLDKVEAVNEPAEPDFNIALDFSLTDTSEKGAKE